ncbi:hypothetical protein MLD38_027037 [Melastoma candidum]|uniref:Uncharacterized protein n=1 Tax=Melastoma candidum TaxID=119954 RepID=A0ACB9P0A3_9MYRT|nr:hypothetical protein MLD38_027037 [Melastoma candidum]
MLHSSTLRICNPLHSSGIWTRIVFMSKFADIFSDRRAEAVAVAEEEEEEEEGEEDIGYWAISSRGLGSSSSSSSAFDFREATIDRIRLAFSLDSLTSHHLVTCYLHQIHSLNPFLRAIIEVNPDALEQASVSDRERLEARRSGREQQLSPLHGIPVLLKDSIGTLDRMNTTCGSYALLGAKVARDAHVVERLRAEGAVLLGKASMSEWYRMRSFGNPNGWSARGGQGVNPYVSSADPCGSSSGSAIAVATNMVTVSLGSETHSSIICPSDHNSVVGFKPTAGLTSRAGIIPVSPRVDSIGPIARTMSDVVYVLDAIVGVDPRDEATKEANKFVPAGGYRQFLKEDSLRGKRLGIVRHPFFASFNGTTVISTFEQHLVSLWERGAIVIDNLEIENVDVILDPRRSGEMIVMVAEFRRYLNEFLVELRSSPVRSLADIIAFNVDHPDMEMTEQYSQDGLIEA